MSDRAWRIAISAVLVFLIVLNALRHNTYLACYVLRWLPCR